MTESTREQRLAERVESLPHSPGVYLMRDSTGKILYVGKAKDLRARVRSYLLPGGDGRAQISYLMRKVEAIDTILTESEEQAFVVELDLIKRHMPRYNIRLKDDKAYLMIRIDRSSPWPRLQLVRRAEDDGALYFGPYPSGYQLRELLEVIKRVVLLRTCSDTIFHNRARPCLEYQIRRCSGPCCLPVDREEYQGWVQSAIGIIQGKASGVIKELNALMNMAAEDLRFEEAAAHRDRITVLERFSKGQQVVLHAGGRQDIFALYREGRLGALCVLSMVNGRVADSRNFSFDGLSLPTEEVIQQSVEQYYDQGFPIPEEVLVSEEIPDSETTARWLSGRADHAVEVTQPQRGSKVRLVRLAELNAKQHFSNQHGAVARYGEISTELRRRFNLRQAPRRIECVDISNFQGTEIVGVVVSFYDGAPEKANYKKYKIRSGGSPDDFGSILEVVTRRLTRGLEEGDFPDLLVIDGGDGQLAKALEARETVKVPLDIISLAKLRNLGGATRREMELKPERVFLEGVPDPIPLAGDDPLTHFMQRLRDETHRFAITFHRSRRGKRSLQSMLDEIPGVGPERRRRLLTKYQSVAKLKDQPVAEIAATGRMSKLLAQKILDQLGKGK